LTPELKKIEAKMIEKVGKNGWPVNCHLNLVM
jgi:hypothetical protein